MPGWTPPAPGPNRAAVSVRPPTLPGVTRQLLLAALTAAAVLTGTLIGCGPVNAEPDAPTVPAASDYPARPSENVRGPYPVTRVVDGDTIWVDNAGSREKIRMIGLDTPEVVDPRKPVECFGQEASQRAKSELSGRTVFLETDPSQGVTDRYGRTLAYVWTDAGRLFNLDMIADGYGFEYTYAVPYRYQEQFRSAQTAAREQNRGLWSPTACPD